MKLFMILCDKISGPCFFVAATASDAQIRFCNGLKNPEKYIMDPTFRVVEVGQLIAVAPEEFRLTDDCSF